MKSLLAWNQTSEEFKAQIIGKLLGDGSLTQQRDRKPRFQFTHMAKDYEWSLFCYHKLRTHLQLNPPRFRKTWDSRLKKGYCTAYYTQSKTSDLATFLRNAWYPNGIKQVPFDLLKEHITTETLAWWYMDDGHLKTMNGKIQKVILSTESYTQQENEMLIQLLNQRFNLKFKTDKQNRLILYEQYLIHYFHYLIEPYMHVCMHRKMINQFLLPNNVLSKRTTIYLPKCIQVIKPTEHINKALNRLDELIALYKSGDFYKVYGGKLRNPLEETHPYQIVVSSQNLRKLLFLKEATGLTMSEITELVYK